MADGCPWNNGGKHLNGCGCGGSGGGGGGGNRGNKKPPPHKHQWKWKRRATPIDGSRPYDEYECTVTGCKAIDQRKV
jgi:hypothetical protein